MKKDILQVFGTNLIRMVVALFATFFLPAVLDVDSYGYVKLYQLYVSYIGFMHLGYCDGVYLKYGGLSYDENRDCINKDLQTMKIFQMAISFVVIVIGILKVDFIVLVWGITVFPRNIRTFYEYSYQATGKFKEYSGIVNGYSLITILFYIITIFVFQIKTYRLYIAGFCIVDIVTLFLGKYYFGDGIIGLKQRFDKQLFSGNIKSGFFLMLGNFANTIFLSIDKWFVKGYMGMTSFAYYSFATQILMLVTMFTTPVTMTLYNYFSKNKSHKFENDVCKHLISIIFIMLCLPYAIELVITEFLPQYSESIDTIYILFLAQVFSSINAAIFVNLYKTYKLQSKYFINLCGIIVLSVIANFVFYMINKSITSFAFATLGCMMCMLLINLKSFSHLKFGWKEYGEIICFIFVYIMLCKCHLPFFSFIVYILVYILILFMFEREELLYWKEQIMHLVDYIRRLLTAKL